MSTTVTTIDGEDESLEYHDAPKWEYQLGERSEVKEFWNLFVNGDLTECFVHHIAVTNRSREFVVAEREWYFKYTIGMYGRDGNLICTERLTPDEMNNHF